MSGLEHLPFRALTAAQRGALAAMEVDLYQRRQLPRVAEPVSSKSVTWSDASASPLARAVARAAGMDDVAQWCIDWQAAGLRLPDLAELRAQPAAKRAFWRLLRARRR